MQKKHIVEAVISGFGDAQLVAAPAILLSATLPGIWASLSIYHFNMIYNYALLAIATNFCALVTQTHYFHSWLMASFRLSMLAVTVYFTSCFMSLRLKSGFPVLRSVEQAELIASFNNQFSSENNRGLVIAEIVFTGITVIFSTTYAIIHSITLKDKKRKANMERQRTSLKFCCAVVVINFMVALYAIFMMLYLRRWMINDSKLLVQGETEQEMSFGQAVPVALMAFAPLNTGLRAVSGETHCSLFSSALPCPTPSTSVSMLTQSNTLTRGAPLTMMIESSTN